MSRNPKIEEILKARWELEHCEQSERAGAETKLNQLLDLIVAETQGQCNREQILDCLFDRYKEYRREKRKSAQVQIAQASLGTPPAKPSVS